MGSGSCQFVQFVAEKWVATAVPYTLSRSNDGRSRTISMGRMIWMETAVPNLR